jgi:predicted NUDIX family NTP pyrophosphohydrolase
MTENKKSAGILLYRERNGEFEYFIIHPGGPFWKNKEINSWSIPKGGVEEGEDMLETAKREFIEETGNNIEFDSEFIELTPVKLKSGKKIHAFAVYKDVDLAEIKSNFFEMEFPTGSGVMRSFPEVDKGGWFNKQKCEELLNKKQYNFVIELESKINEKNG